MASKLSRLLGLGLLAGAYLPLHRLLVPGRAGPAGAATRASAEAAWGMGLYGTLIVLGLAFVLSRVVGTSQLAAVGNRLLGVIEHPTAGAFAALTGGTAFLLASALARILYSGSPTSVDELVQLLHAVALSEGRLGIPLAGDPAAWIIQNGLATDEGWASVYPPFHTLMLALGTRFGTAWMVGPLAIGAATAFATASFELLLTRPVGRVAGVMLALCPFWLSIGGTHLSHTTAAAALAATLWTSLRARSGGAVWALAAGAAVGAAVSSRPWVGIVGGATLITAPWLLGTDPTGRSKVFSRLAAMSAGGLPFAVLLFWWNDRLFGHPLRLGYSATFGPAHGLGLHVDPWGNQYGVREALAYTGADLTQLGVRLFETPLPAIALVGGALLIGASGRHGGTLIAWVLASIAANAVYWHHGIHFGPRMTYEAIPGWVSLFALAAFELVRGIGVPDRARAVVTWSVALSLLGGAALVPGVMVSHADQIGTWADDIPVLRDRDRGPAVVFVHGSWSSRIASRLVAAGMRRDSVETALRRNDICAVSQYARWRADPEREAGGPPPPLDLSALPGGPGTLRARVLSPGNVVRVDPTAAFDVSCEREARADRFGAIELESLIWRYPPLPSREVIVARDLGPTTNLTVREAVDRPAYVLIDSGAGAPARVLEFGEGMELLWGGAAGAATDGG